MYVDGPERTDTPAPDYRRLDPRFDPNLYQDYDNLGFSFKSIAKAVKKVASPIQKVAGKVVNPVLKVAGKVAAPLTSIGAGILRNVPGGGFLVGAVTGVKNLVTGNKANNLQRIATNTIKAAGPVVSALPISAPPAVIMSPVLPTQDSPAAIIKRQKSFGQRILDAGSRLKTNAGIAATAVSKVADQAGAIAAAADSAAQAGDQVGAKRLRDTAARLAQLARSGQATASEVASVIQQGGAAAQGAAAGAVAGAGAEQASQGISDFLGTTAGKLTAAGLVAGGFLLLRGHGGNSGGGSRRRVAGDSYSWE